MPDVTIASTVTGLKWQGEDAPKLRVFANNPFVTAEGVPINPGPSPFFLEVDCELEGETNNVIVPEIVLPSTEDSSRPDAMYSAKFYHLNTLGGASEYAFSVFSEGFRLPPSPRATVWALIGSPVTIRTELAVSYLERVMAAGGVLTSVTIAAVDNLAEDLELADLRSKILRLNLFAGSNLAAALVPIIGSAPDTNVNFVAGDYSEATGLDAGAANSNKYLDTGLSPADEGLSLSDASLGVYALNDSGGSTNRAIGCADTVNEFSVFPFVGGSSNTILFAAFDAGGNGRVERAYVFTSEGFTVGSRTGTNDARVYRDGQQIGTVKTDVPTSDPPDKNIFVFGYNANGALGAPVSLRLAAYFIGLGLSNDDVANLFLILRTFNEAIGRL